MKALYIITTLIVIIYAQELSLDLNQTTITPKSTEQESDDFNFCLALSKKNLKYCTNIINKDNKSYCFGILQKNSGYCIMIKDKDIKNSCLSIALSDISYCKKITDENQQNSCNLFYLKNEEDKKEDDCKE